MAVYRPKRNGEVSKYYVCEFVYQGKRFQESTGVPASVTVALGCNETTRSGR